MRFLIIAFFFFLLNLRVFGQCPEPKLYDINFTRAVSDPVWVNCIDNSNEPDAFSLSFVSPNDIHNYVLDFGDGSAPAMGTLWTANTPLIHDYPLGRFTVTLSETQNGCTATLTGEVVNDRKAGATAIPPTLGTSGCVPHTLTFINNSANTSQFTRFEWNWGDGTTEEQDASSVGQPISHVFEKGKAGCNMVVELWAFSMCDTTFSSYGPYDFWDIDTAVVTASATRICGGQDVTFTDQTLYNCNVKQPRKIRWDFRELGGPLTDWLPATPENRSQTYFVTGNVGDRFTVYMLDSNFCGIDPALVTVEIIGPPVAQAEVYDPVICAGETGRFKNTSTGNADIYYWDFGDGSAIYSTGTTQDVSRRYKSPGTYTVKLIAAVSGTDLCRDTTEQKIEVLPSSVSEFSVDKTSGCSPETFRITENSSNAVDWFWDFGTLGTFMGKDPGPLSVTEPGSYQIALQTVNSLGCGSTKTTTVSVYPSVFAAAVVDSVCFGVPVNFTEGSTLEGTSSCAEGTILREKWDNITGSTVSDLITHPSFQNSPSSSSLLTLFESPTNEGTNYGSRIRGFICPPQTGNYVFWIASDDNSELWISTDANPLNKSMIASVSGFTASREWTRFSSQQSVPVYLVAGNRYYIEALHKEGTGGDHLAVGWQLPSGARERPIPGSRLSPYSEGSVINAWTWNFGDGNSSAEREPTYTYAASGEYQVQLIASTGKCSDTATYPVVIFPAVEASFALSDTAGCTPLSLDIYNESNGGKDFTWDYGDGSPLYNSTASVDTINHVFINNTGEDQDYYISLIAESGEGCRDTMVRSVKVYPGPVANFAFLPEVPKCSPVDIEFTNNSSAADYYEWHFGRYDTLSHSTKKFKYNFINKSGNIRYDTISLRAYSSSGCYGEMTKVVTIFPEAEFLITADPDTGCHPLPVLFRVTGGASSFQWVFGNGNSSLASSPQQIFANEESEDTVYSVRFSGESAFGCKDTAYTSVVVYPNPQALIVNDVSAGCSPLTVNFSDLSTGVTESHWDFGDGATASGGEAEMAHQFYNHSNSPMKFKTTLYVKNAFGCSDSVTTEITVYPNVNAAFTLSDTAGCSPLAVSTTNNTSGNANYFWEFGNGQVSSAYSPVQNYINSQESDTSFIITLTATSDFGCMDKAVDTVTVYSLPVASFTNSNTPGCSPLPVDFVNTSTNYAYSHWTFSTGQASTIDSTGNVSYVFVNNSNSAIDYPVNMTAFSEHGCTDHVMKKITVYPLVKAAMATTDTAGCSPWEVRFYNVSGGSGSAVWDFGDGTQSIATSANHTFLNASFNKDTVYTVSLYASNQYGCADTVKKQVVVYPNVKAEFLKDATAGCSPLAVNFINNSLGATSHTWDFGTGEAVENNSDSIVFLYENTGKGSEDYKIVLTVANDYGCSSVYSSNVAVYPQVLAEIAGDSSGCTPFAAGMSYAGTGADQFQWFFGDGDVSLEKAPAHTFINSSFDADTVFHVSLIASNSFGCSDTATHAIHVFPKPKAEFMKDATAGCSPLKVNFINNSQGGTSYVWDFDVADPFEYNEDSLSFVFENKSSVSEDFEIVMTATNGYGCSSFYKSSILVYPEINIAIQGDSAGCAPFMARFSYMGEGADQLKWNFGDGGISVEQAPSHTFSNPSFEKDTTYVVSVIAINSFGCSDTSYHTVTVFPKPKAEFIKDAVSGCSPLAVTFTNKSQGGTSHTWDFDITDPVLNNADSVTTVFTNNAMDSEEFEVVLTASNDFGCSSNHLSKVLVYPPVRAEILADSAGCSPFATVMNSTGEGADQLRWSFGDGEVSLENTPTHSFSNSSFSKDTIYIVSLIGTSSYGCSDTAFHNITVYPVPIAEFTRDIISGCSPLNVSFSNDSRGGTAHSWNFGTGLTQENNTLSLSHLFENKTGEAEEYTVSLTSSNQYGCSSSYSSKITVFPAVTATFTSDPSGCTPFQVKLAYTGEGADQFKWDFGDGEKSSEEAPTHIYQNVLAKDTSFTISLIALSAYGCSDTTTSLVTVYSRPIADFTASPTEITLPDSVITVLNKSSSGDWNYFWSFGDGTSSDLKNPGTHNYGFYGTYDIYLIVSGNNCSDTASQTVKVNPTTPVAAFEGEGEGCQPLSVQFTNKSIFAEEYLWSFGDGETSTQKNPNHVYSQPGIYTVTLKVKGEGGDDEIVMEDVVKVYAVPTAFFKVKPDSKIVKIPGNSHYFANLSENASAYHWDFGDGSTSSESSPFHAYTTAGEYDVTLTATSEEGCMSIYKEESAAIAEAGGKIIVPNAFTPSGGGNLNSAGKNDVFYPLSEGVVTFHMMIFNRWGELIFESKQVNVGWDGYYRGELCKQDVYVFKIQATFVDGEKVELVGDVTLIR